MAVYTQVQDSELAQFLKQYDIGILQSHVGIAEGVENSNYLLTTTEGKFILTLFEQRTPVQDLPFFLNLKEHLAERGFPCPLPILRINGEKLGPLAGRMATIVSFLDGKSITSPTPDQCQQVGETLGQLHQSASDFKMQRKNGLDLPAWRPLFEKSGARSEEVQAGLTDWIDQELKFLQANWPTDLSYGVIHADLFRDNVFFNQQQLSGVIDFYFACTDFLAYDLAITMNAWCFQKNQDHFECNAAHAEALLKGYNRIRPLTPPEIRSFPILCRGAALRFLLTRLYDWLNVPPGALTIPHDPKEYIDKLRFHQETSFDIKGWLS